MPKATPDETPLADESAIRAIVHRLGLSPQYSEPADRAKHPTVTAHWDALPYWGRYFDDKVVRYKWTGRDDVWLAADADGGALRRVVISGLKDEKEARVLRAEAIKLRAATGVRLTTDDIARLAEEIASDPERERRDYQRTFRYHLTYIHRYFEWSDGEVRESKGHILPISQSTLQPDDVDLLRAVFARLPPSDSKVTLRDDAPRAKAEPIKSLKKAREKVKQHSGEYAEAGFDAWVSECLQTKTDKWSRSRDPLYVHYKAWTRKGGHGQNLGEKAEAKVTGLSEVKWGMLMRRRFPDAWRQDKRSILYRVTVKRGA